MKSNRVFFMAQMALDFGANKNGRTLQVPIFCDTKLWVGKTPGNY